MRCLELLLALVSAAEVGKNVVAELYALAGGDGGGGVVAGAIAAAATTTATPTAVTTAATTAGAPSAAATTAAEVHCAYQHTAYCNVTPLLRPGVTAGDILLLGLASATDCSDADYSTYSLGSTPEVVLKRNFPLTMDRDYVLCERLIASGQVASRGLVHFDAATLSSQCTEGAAPASDKAHFLSIFDTVECEVPAVDNDDEGYLYTVPATATCGEFDQILKNDLRCGTNSQNHRCTLNLQRFEGTQTLCRCDFSVIAKGEEDTKELSDVFTCTPEMAEMVMVLAAPAGSQRRRLEASTAVATTAGVASKAVGVGTTKALQGLAAEQLFVKGSCTINADCGAYGVCLNKVCAGFTPDQDDVRVIRCVEGYRCDVAGELSGVGITPDFLVIGISPSEVCGTAEALPARLSIFANANKWRCVAGGGGEFCEFSLGVGQRRNKTISLEGLRLCGCPALDLDGSGRPCDSASEFIVPLAKLGVQECLTNAHCLHKTFAYCVNDHCAGFMGIAASAGMKAYQCLLNKSCSVQSIAAKTISEGLKIVPVAAAFNCGAEQALDPAYYEESSLPCIMDVNGDGRCDIHLGVPKALGTNRLCGCNGSDRGGNGRACDEPEDFDVDLGFVTVDECNVDADCPSPEMCVANKCYADTQAPYAVATKPANGTAVVPPVNEIRISFSESIRFTNNDARRIVLLSPENNMKYDFPVRDPTQAGSASDAHRIKIEGKDLVLIPDLRVTSLPEGHYMLGFEGGIVEDLQGNGNVGSTDYAFQITSDAGCPFLGVTGFSVDNVNINGIYRSTGVLNGRPRWTSIVPTIDGLNDSSQVFWFPGANSSSARWVVGVSLDQKKFLSYLDVPFSGSTSTDLRPVSGKWRKWIGGRWKDQNSVIVECITTRNITPPRFLNSDPLPNARGVPTDDLEITFTFDRPTTFGHWSQILVSSADGAHEIVINPDDEEHVRNKVLRRNLEDNQIILALPEPLRPGTEYNVIVDTGAFTDLQYNPVAPIFAGDFKLFTYGMPCEPYPVGLYNHLDIRVVPANREDWSGASYLSGGYGELDDPSAAASWFQDPDLDYLAAEERRVDHGGQLAIACVTNYSPRFKQHEFLRHSDKLLFTEERTVALATCLDGEWDFLNMPCLADCPAYQAVNKQYNVTLYKLGADYNDLADFEVTPTNSTSLKSGSQVLVQCIEHSETLAGSSLGEVSTCYNGRWSSIPLKCGTTCGPFPSLGKAFNIISSSGGLSVGASRTISCAADALGDRGRTETLVCLDNGNWQTPSISCYFNCGPLDVGAFSMAYSLTPSLAGLTASKSEGVLGETYVFKCEENTIPSLDYNATAADEPSWVNEYWDEVEANFPLSDAESQTQVSCLEGQWTRRQPLVCQKSCSRFVTPGAGYDYSLVFGDGTAPGSAYNVTCKSDAIAKYISKRDRSDQFVCLRGQWTRMSHKIECLGSCPHPKTYFGSNYRVADESGHELVPPSVAINYRHHSHTFILECETGAQPLEAPLLADAALYMFRGGPYSDAAETVQIADAKPIPTLFENPTQAVTCSDGEWVPLLKEGIAMTTNKLLRCSPYCPSMTSMYSARYVRTEDSVGFGWGSKRQFACAEGLSGGHVGRFDNGTLGFVPRPQLQLVCARGSWVAPAPPFDLAELNVTLTPLRESIIVKHSQTTATNLHTSMTAALPCGRTCSKTALESIVNEYNFKIVRPSRSAISKNAKHGTLVEVSCDVNSQRISGPLNDVMACADGEWTIPLLVCGTPSCGDGAINNGEQMVDCGGAKCTTSCPTALHSCEQSRECASCKEFPNSDAFVFTIESEGYYQGNYLNPKTSLPLAHGTLVHAHHRESYYLPVQSLAQPRYLPYICINGIWEQLTNGAMTLGKRQLADGATSSEEAPEPLVVSDGAADEVPKEFAALANGALAMQGPSCYDGVLSRGEWGIDCGGVCALPCADCFDSTMNGDESWVDCGGQNCRACRQCSLASLKGYNTANYVVQEISVDLHDVSSLTLEGSRVQGGEDPTYFSMRLEHGEGLRVNCSSTSVLSGGTAPLDVVCLDSHWWPLEIAHEMAVGTSDVSPADFTVLPTHALRCENLSTYTLQDNVFHRFQSSAGLSLSFCREESTQEYCCGLLEAFNAEMAGECGALLFGGNVKAYCRGICYQRIKQITQYYDAIRPGAASSDSKNFETCQKVTEALQKVTTAFCYTNDDEFSVRKSLTNPQSVYYGTSDDFCFSGASKDLAHLRTLDVYHLMRDIDIACAKRSCFRSNVGYVDAMWQLIHLDAVVLTDEAKASLLNGRRRRLLEQGLPISPFLRHLEEIEQLRPGDLMKGLVAAILDLADDQDRVADALANLTDTPISNRRLSAGISRAAPVLNTIFRDPTSVQYSDAMVPLMCLKDNESRSCSAQFRQLLRGISLWDGQTSLRKADRYELGRAVAGVTGSCSDSSCFLQLSRHLGQEINDRGINRGDPYQRFMGLFLKLFGRYYCQMDSDGNSCGVKYMGYLVQGMQPGVHRRPSRVKTEGEPPSSSWGSLAELLPNCESSTKCASLSYVNDGVCDPECFNVHCGFDGYDCFVSNMFPGIVDRLMKPLDASSHCHPLNKRFDICPKNFECYNVIKRSIIEHGCCFAVGVDILKEVMDLEYYSHPLIRTESETYLEMSQYADMDAMRERLVEWRESLAPSGSRSQFGSHLDDHLIDYSFYTPDRSSIFSQTACGIYQDRTCSRGISRRVISVHFETDSPSYDSLAWMMAKMPHVKLHSEFPYSQVDFDAFDAAVNTEAPVLRLKALLRKALADLLVLPLTDVREVNIWPSEGSTASLVQIIVDPGLFIKETQNILQSLDETGDFANMVSASVAQWRKGLSDIVDSYLSIVESTKRMLLTLDPEPAPARQLAAAEIDQKKNTLIESDKVRQVPVTLIKNVQFNIQQLDPVHNDRITDVATEGTFDLGILAGPKKTCSVRALISINDPWSNNQTIPFSAYQIHSSTGASSGLSNGITGVDGEIVAISCKHGYAASEGTSQKIVCTNGKWLSYDRQPLLRCMKPCPHFHLVSPSPSMYRVVGDGNTWGSIRRVSCASGYTAADGAGSEDLVCKNGEWTSLTLTCKKATLFDGTCAGVPLEMLTTALHYKMTEVVTGLPSTKWWKATCQRGYEASHASYDPLYLACLDDSSLVTFGSMSYHLQQSLIKSSSTALESALRQFIADATLAKETGEVELARLMWSASLPLKQQNNSTLVCDEAVITKPELLVESGIDDWVYIGVVAGIAFGATLLFGLWGYYWQTRGRQKRNLKKAKKAHAKAKRQEAVQLLDPTEQPNIPSTEPSDPAPQPQRKDERSSQGGGYYSDVEYYTKDRGD